MSTNTSGDQGYPGTPHHNPSSYPPQPPQQPGDGQEQQSPMHHQTLSANPHYPQQQRKSSQRGGVVGLSIVAVLLVLICSGVGVAIYIGAQKAKDTVHSNISALSASAMVTRFCTYYESQDYGSIYQMLSKAAQGRTSQTQFATHQAAVDRSTGQVVRCGMGSDHSLPGISNDGVTATARIQVARGENANLTTGTLILVYEDSDWRIDSADSSLKLL